MDCADGKGAPPVELEFAWNARAYGALPEAGGQLDQPAGLLKRMRMAENVYDAWSAWKRSGSKADEFIKNQPAAWKIVKMILKERNG